jgi:hypothetical protein
MLPHFMFCKCALIRSINTAHRTFCALLDHWYSLRSQKNVGHVILQTHPQSFVLINPHSSNQTKWRGVLAFACQLACMCVCWSNACCAECGPCTTHACEPIKLINLEEVNYKMWLDYGFRHFLRIRGSIIFDFWGFSGLIIVWRVNRA